VGAATIVMVSAKIVVTMFAIIVIAIIAKKLSINNGVGRIAA
jgi:hypothetical protein